MPAATRPFSHDYIIFATSSPALLWISLRLLEQFEPFSRDRPDASERFRRDIYFALRRAYLRRRPRGELVTINKFDHVLLGKSVNTAFAC